MTIAPLSFDFFGILSDVNAFTLFMIFVGSIIGAFSRKLSIAAFGGLLVFVHVVIETDLWIFDALLYLVLIIVLLWVSFHVIAGYMEAGEGEPA